MQARKFDVEALVHMAHSPIRNYAIPGLTSSLVGGNGHGCIRLFECERDHQEEITPHNHRFDFQCLVLTGEVRNRVWLLGRGDLFARSTLTYGGACGKYTVERDDVCSYGAVDTVYREGDWYSMQAEEIHSIHFARGTKVLFFEGPNRLNTSVILEPFIDGEVIPTFEVKPWMFKR